MKPIGFFSDLSIKSSIVATIFLSTTLTIVPEVWASQVLNLKQKIWQIQSPSIPSVDNSSTYLPKIDRNIVSSRLILDLTQSKLDVYRDNKLVASFTIIAVEQNVWQISHGEFRLTPIKRDSSSQPLIGFATDKNNYVGFYGISRKNNNIIPADPSHSVVRMQDKDIDRLAQLIGENTIVSFKY